MALISRGVDALFTASSGTIYEKIGAFRDLADQAAVPIYSFYKNGVLNGALAALSSDYFRMSDELLIPMARKVLIDKKERQRKGVASRLVTKRTVISH
jgi:ABC-type uncharacterized transport system substrate-binding protein